MLIFVLSEADAVEKDTSKEKLDHDDKRLKLGNSFSFATYHS